MARAIRLWSGERPSGHEADERIRKELRIVRSDGYRLVRDPWGQRVKVELDRVRTHVLYHPRDRQRWRFIPTIIPGIKQAHTLYRKGNTFGYESSLFIAGRPRGRRRTVFVYGIEDQAEGRKFATVLSPTRAYDIRREKKRAGSIDRTRPNPGSQAYMGTRGPGWQDRVAQRPPGAAPALGHESSIIPAVLAIGLTVGIGWAIARLQVPGSHAGLSGGLNA
jgi:hypothetical protein